MSSEKTPNLGLHKWQAVDYVQRTEFNDNFAKIDDHAKQVTEQLAEKAQQTELIATDTIAKDAQTKSNNPLAQISDNAIPSSKLKQASDSDKIKLANLSQEVRDAIAGTTTIGTTPAPGSVTPTELSDGAATYRKQSKLGKVAYILPSRNTMPDYNTTTGILDFKSTSGAEPSIVYGNERYVISAGTTVNLKIGTATTFSLWFNTVDKTFLVTEVDGTWSVTENHILIATGRSNTGYMSLPCPYTINGETIHASLNTDLSNYMVVMATDPTFTKTSSTTIQIKILGNIFFGLNTGKQIATKWLDTTYEVGQNQVLIWNLDDNQLVVQGNNDTRNKRNIVLASVYNGKIQNGYLKSYYDSWQNNYKPYSHIVFENLTKISIENNVIKLPTVKLYAVGYSGTNAKTYTFTSDNNTFTLAHNQILIWDWDTNEVRIAGNNDARPTKFVILAYCRENTISQGELLPFVTKGNSSTVVYPYTLVDAKPITAENRCFEIVGKAVYQDMTVVNEEVWVFNGSKADHSNYARIYRYDKNTFAEKTDYPLWHNIGHCASADYSHITDYLMVCNGEESISVKPTLYLIKDPKSFATNKSDMVYGNSQIVSVDFFVKNEDDSIAKEIGGSGLIGCFGERDDIGYIMTAPANGQISHRIFRVQFGKGSNDLSDSTGTDVTRWGSFITGKADNEFNGTAKILNIFDGLEYGVSQGITYHDGYIFYTCQNTEILQLQAMENGTFRVVKSFKYLAPVNSDGTEHSFQEPQGTLILDGRYLMMGRYNPGAWILFPLYNEQGGTGNTGEQITLPFPCNSIPQIHITPTSSVTDLYISEVNRFGFTVSSSSGGNGTFSWESKIS